MSRTPCRYSDGPILSAPANLDVEELASEEAQHLSGARVMVAEYDVLQHDFPELRDDNLVTLNPALPGMSGEERRLAINAIIDDWLIANAAYVSTTQATQTIFNTPIATDGQRAVAYRPPLYGRAFVMPTRDVGGVSSDGQRRWPASNGLLDLKGAGLCPNATPKQGSLINGLEYLDFALSDFFIQKIVDIILARELPTVWTIPVYAILDLGFDIVEGNYGTAPAGMHVRRAHRRFRPSASRFENLVTLEIESSLRRYGLTTAARPLQLHVSLVDGHIMWQRGGGQPYRVKRPENVGASLALLRNTDRLTLDRRDVQMAYDVSWPPARAQMVDFGALRVEPRFDDPMIRDFEGLVIDEVIWPEDADFIQPDPVLQLPVERWNRYQLKSQCSTIVDDFRRGAISSEGIRQQIDDCVLTLTSKWPNQGTGPESGDEVSANGHSAHFTTTRLGRD